MCLLVFAWRSHADFPLILAGNRDEFHDRPAEAAHWWREPDGVLAGRDVRAGTVVLADAAGELIFVERRFDPTGSQMGETRVGLKIQAS